ncbi:undecaprenyldiphospho-muramoylpentapeptide beta-N-acetylglucosaminyltransferase [Myxococcota bacterium]|nr:undecaprenyldiphospho-muramoylpentapeptide beta-N-acetylglucosaminyltransferase [Myxococcota bacterium]
MNTSVEKPPIVLIAGGGTGGHLFPGLALAEAFQEIGAEIHFAGSSQGIEVRAVPRAGYPLHLIPVRGIKGRGILRKILGLFMLPAAFFSSWRLLRRVRPRLVVGVGGYASGPVVWTASLLGYRTAILEQNTVPGLTNRKLGRRVRRVYITFPESEQYFPGKKVRNLGNPVRRAIVESLAGGVAATGNGPLRIFIFGGSQGARAINELFMRSAALLAAKGVSIRHQTGAADRERVEVAYREAGVKARVDDFIHDMAGAYAEADIVVCRAGATTCSELAIAGRPAIFIPYPHATDNHQEHNARSLVQTGAAILLLEADATADTLIAHLESLSRDRLAAMNAAMTAAARPRAAAEIRDDLLTL